MKQEKTDQPAGQRVQPPFWHFLLRAWCVGKQHDGLTLPYLVGADAHFRKAQANAEDVLRLVEEIRSYQCAEKYLTVVKHCGWLSEPVIGLNTQARRSGMLVDQGLLWDGLTEVAFWQQRTAYAQALIKDGRFSRPKNGAGWRAFAPDEVKFIDEAISEYGKEK